jgi:hypothetical protein
MPKIQMICDGTDFFIVFNGKQIAKRGHPGTPQAKTWVSLEPGFCVYDGEGGVEGGEIVIECNDVRVH